MRDDFQSKTKRLLAGKVGYRCSNPQCQKGTSGPDSTGTKAVSIGVAAHITAAAEGGPRFDPSKTSDERASESNGIWLCQTCSKLVDSDPLKYTKELLQAWKETAEHCAAAEVQGTPVVSNTAQDGHAITFKSEDWKMWRSEGVLDSHGLIVSSVWKRGDVQYSVRIRLRNNLNHEEVLHHLCMEFVDGESVIFSDESAFRDNETVLPSGKWISIDVDDGLHDFKIFERATEVWCRAESLNEGETLRWLVAEIDHDSVTFPSESRADI